MDLDLNSDWVILSACETTSGDDNSNETFSGLIRAFFFSGTKSIMATQWPIEDKSAVLFTTTMIKEYKRSNDKAFALNESSRNLINNSINEKFSHPSFWAPFILIGS
jgi:CHAT domain-containing protein